MQKLTKCSHYKIVRYYNPLNFRTDKVMDSGLTLKAVQEHCTDPSTRKENVYFDGYIQACRGEGKPCDYKEE